MESKQENLRAAGEKTTNDIIRLDPEEARERFEAFAERAEDFFGDVSYLDTLDHTTLAPLEDSGLPDADELRLVRGYVGHFRGTRDRWMKALDKLGDTLRYSELNAGKDRLIAEFKEELRDV